MLVHPSGTAYQMHAVAMVCVCERVHYRDAVPGAVRPVCPGEGDVLRGPAPGEEGTGEPDV